MNPSTEKLSVDALTQFFALLSASSVIFFGGFGEGLVASNRGLNPSADSSLGFAGDFDTELLSNTIEGTRNAGALGGGP